MAKQKTAKSRDDITQERSGSCYTNKGRELMKNALFKIIVAALCTQAVLQLRAATADLVIADFEGTNYRDWKTTGEAFGPGPARGTLPHQMQVRGFQGKGLVDSFYGGDASTGTLTSAEFKIERNYIHFLIGGGGWAGKTCMNLIVDGKVVRTATGSNTEPGGSEALQPDAWDVADLIGKTAHIEIVDNATGGWGHINADDILQTDRKPPRMLTVVARKFRVEKRYLNLPVKKGAPRRHVTFLVDGNVVRWFDIELADGKPDWWAFMDLTPFKGKEAVIKVNRLPEDSLGLSSINQSDHIKNYKSLCREALRPQFHFTTRRGWNNDPNGLVFYDGEYHLFYQHNPYGVQWGNMSWGHAVSKDLVHWKELPVALYPDKHGTMYSGSAAVDWNNTAGLQTGKEPALVAMFTAAGNPFTQEIAFSNDRGRSWTKYTQNPVLGHVVAENRDPKVVWYAPEKKWVMSLYLDHHDYAIFESPDLKHWRKLQDFTLPGDAECPNFFEMPLDGDTHNPRWVFFGASGVYVVGKFDGHKFTPETQPRHMESGNCWYAAQVYSDIPPGDGRCILIPWGRLPNEEIFRSMPFNQMMGLPVELTLHSSPSGTFLKIKPVRELASLRQRTFNIKPQPIAADSNPLVGIKGDLFEIKAQIAVGTAREITFDLRGLPVTYEVANQKLTCMGCEGVLKPVDGIISLHVFVDRRSVDIYGGQGTLYMPMASALSPDDRSLKLSCSGGSASIHSMKVYELKSAWQ